MAGMDINLQVETRGLLKALGEATRRGHDMRPAWEEVGDIMLASVAENFRVGGRPPWPPLKDEGLARGRSRRRTRGKILDASGALAKSIHAQATSESSVIGSDLPYAEAHQNGTQHLLARPFLVVQPEDERAICEVIHRYLTEPIQ